MGSYLIEEQGSLNISDLLKRGFIKRGEKVPGEIVIPGIGTFSFVSVHSQKQKFIVFNYLDPDLGPHEKHNHFLRIDLISIKSNLGFGEIIYFVCPITGRKARILYWNHEGINWQSRFAYGNRLLYKSQLIHKKFYDIDRYWHISSVLHELNAKRVKHHYRGKYTKLQKRINNLELKRTNYELGLLTTYLVLLHNASFPKHLAMLGLTLYFENVGIPFRPSISYHSEQSNQS